MSVREVQIGDEKYFVRKFTVKEYLKGGFTADDQEANIIGSLALGLANEDGSRRYPANGVQVTDEARQAIEDMPFGVAARLVQEVTDFNELDTPPKK